jgi:hypothetical protein
MTRSWQSYPGVPIQVATGERVGYRRYYRRYGYPVPYAYYPPAYDVPPPVPEDDYGDAPPDGDYAGAPPDSNYGDTPPEGDYANAPPDGDYGDAPPPEGY